MSPNSDAITRIAYAWGIAFAPHALKIIMLGQAGYKWDNRVGEYSASHLLESIADGNAKVAQT